MKTEADYIEQEILKRINKKMASCLGFRVKSITLGFDIYNKLRDKIDSRLMGVYSLGFPTKFGQLFGHPIKIAHKRKNLIQINSNKPRRHKNKFLTTDYLKILNSSCSNEDYQQMSIYNEKLRKISKDSGISFLTSSQQPAKLHP